MLSFLELKESAFGLDLSDHSLKIAYLKKKNNNFKLISFNEVLLKPGLIQKGEIKKIDEVAELIKKTYREAKGKKIKTKNVVVSLPEEKAFLEEISLVQSSPEDLRSILLLEAEKHIPLPLDQVYLDYQMISPIDNSNKLSLLLSAFPVEIINSYLTCLAKADLKPVVLENESLALSRALIPPNYQKPLLLIDFGAGRTIFIFYALGSVRFVFLPAFTFSQLDELVAQTLKVDLITAEKLKIKHGLTDKFSETGQQIFKCLISPLEALTQEIKKCLDYCETHFLNIKKDKTQAKIEKILLSGGGARLKGLETFLSLQLNLPVELVDPFLKITNKLTLVQKKEFLNYTGALGLALRGADL